MKRIIITESQYKKLVRQPLNEQNKKGGKIIFSDGYSENDIISDRVWNFLNILKEKLWSKYSKNLFISGVVEYPGDEFNRVWIDIDINRYNNKEKRFIRNFIKKGEELYGRFMRYWKNTDSMVFNVPSSELKINNIENELEDPVETDLEIEEPEIEEPDTVDEDDNCVEGNCQDGEGKIVYENGDIFEGIFENGEIVNGTYKFENGDIYIGQFKDDDFYGDGTFISHSKNIRYDGIWDNGILRHHQIITYEDGTIYEGETNDLIRQGYGKEIKPNGDEYNGDFFNDKKEGQGKYIWDNGDVYDGEWEDGSMTKGNFVSADGKILDGTFEDGEFIDGTYTDENGVKWKIEKGKEPEILSDEGEIEDETGTEEEETEIEVETGTEEEETDCIDGDNTKFYQDNITNIKETNDFRWWVHQDEDRLKKVNDKLEECGYDDGLNKIINSSYDDTNVYMIISFGEVGQDWINDGKPEKVIEYEVEITDERLYEPTSTGNYFRKGNNDLYGNRGHSGHDYIAKNNPVVFMKTGEVCTAKFNTDSCGGTITIVVEGENRKAIFCHMSEIYVTPKQTIVPGTVIGVSGGGSGQKGKGHSTGPHLHFGMKNKGKCSGGGFIDPDPYKSDFKFIKS